MSKLIKILWALISLIPLLFVLMLVFWADFLWNKTMPIFLLFACIVSGLTIVLFVFCIIIIKVFVKKLDEISFDIEEIESKDGSVASSIITYLLPLITITFTEINWIAFGGLLIVMVSLLFGTRVALLNPMLYLFGYKYYSIKAKSGAKYTLISKQKKFNKNNKKIMVEIFDDIFIELEVKND
ncbi:MAG: hypothetical protein J1G07_05430 [Clostridiales bacterium]|nr:hypothetical protein [Clostridiales bacterium]